MNDVRNRTGQVFRRRDDGDFTVDAAATHASVPRHSVAAIPGKPLPGDSPLLEVWYPKTTTPPEKRVADFLRIKGVLGGSGGQG
ncbi:MAG: hypothetical protein ACLQOO_17450 [Terriglobia bacterium]